MNPYLAELERIETKGFNLSRPARDAAWIHAIPHLQREQILEALRARGWRADDAQVVWVHDVVENSVGA